MSFFKINNRQLKITRRLLGRLNKNIPLWSDARLLHPEWLYRPVSVIPEFSIVSNETPVTEIDLEISERLLSAFKVGVEYCDESERSALWSMMAKTYHVDLLNALEQRNVKVLAKELASMFQRPAVQGMFVRGGLTDKLRQEWLSIQTIDVLVSLAEYLALVPVDNPEQGRICAALDDGVQSLVERVEAALGNNITMPSVGSPWGIDLSGRIAVPRTLRHHYTASRVLDIVSGFSFCRKNEPLNFVEIGAGFGGTARCIMESPDLVVERYTIIDLPLVNVLQGYYLARTLGPEKVAFVGEDTATSSAAKVNVWPMNYALSKLADENIDVLLNEDSLPEIPKHIGLRYIDELGERLQGFFLSINHEADSSIDSEAQVKVSEIVTDTRLKRCNRQPSWVRPGYVEEIYVRS